MAIDLYAGETWRVTARDLTHVSSGPVTSGATVTVDLYDSEDVLISTGTGTASGDDWYVDVAMPDTPGVYVLKVTAEHNDAVSKHRDRITVKAF